MNNLQKGVILLSIGTLVFFPFIVLSENGIRGIIIIDKATFLEGEPIWVTSSAVNAGTKPLKWWYLEENRFDLKNSNGKSYEYKCGKSRHGTTDSWPLTLRPGEEADHWTGHILSCYGNYNFSPHYILSPDQYTIQAISYSYDPEIQKREEIRSDVVRFEVIEPKGEEKEAFELLKKGYQFEWKDLQKSLGYFRMLIQKYPKSTYSPSAMHYMIVNTSVRIGQEEALELIREMIDRYPNSRHTIRNLRTISIYYTNRGIYDEELIKNELREIGEKHKGTKVEESVKEMLDEFEKGTSVYHRSLRKRNRKLESKEKNEEIHK
jgi:hypothetical protein